MEQASLILSIIALLGSLATYIVHDRKIKKQEAKINEYQLARFKEEEEDSKKAQICGNIIKYYKGKRVLKVYNKGKSPAKNIRIEGIDENKFYIHGMDLLPYELLNPQDGFEMNIVLYTGSPKTLKLSFFWDDAVQDNNEFTQVLSLI
jgi:hypothetical protein